MKAKVKQVNSYSIEINGVTHEGFEKVAEWNGMIEFKSKDGIVIVNDDSSFDNVFANIFSSSKHGEEKELDLVKASPCMHPSKYI